MPLTDKQKRVLELRAQGYRNKQIANMLGISDVTIHQHLRACCRKLNAVNTAHAIALATTAGILTKLGDANHSAASEGARLSGVQTGGHAPEDAPEAGHNIVLTPKERDILNCVLLGETNVEIAARYKLTLKTVETYFMRMSRRNNVSGRMTLALSAVGATTLRQP